ncbi:MAG: hypothetical protein CVV44_05860 [Spirochaetae bacterium HGW-Spirochaetae-1]|jgi:electron transport complex protein RnfG|nr:MAG: hypothetical protein CVV44_05860 [Spirochaetae bacterium HGW-Spirochaetae-1]
MMNTIIKPTLILTAVAFIAAFVLSHVEKITYPNILKQKKVKQDNALLLILPGYKIVKENKTEIDHAAFHYWIGEKEVDGKPVKAYAFIAASAGYGGPVESIVGVDENNRILGISILNQTETPGLGARCMEIASQNTLFGKLTGVKNGDDGNMLPWFQEQFSGLSLDSGINILKKGDWSPAMKNELMERNAITSITGATITGRAVIRSLDSGFKKLQKALSAESNSAGGQK